MGALQFQPVPAHGQARLEDPGLAKETRGATNSQRGSINYSLLFRSKHGYRWTWTVECGTVHDNQIH